MLDPDAQTSASHRTELQAAWSQMQSALSDYKTSTLDERILVEQLQQRLRQHWQQMVQVLSGPDDDRYRRSASFYGQKVLPLRTSVLEITTRVEDIDARQLASAEADIERQFKCLGRQLTLVLNIALGAALLLAAGCLIYVLKIEKQSRSRYREILLTRVSSSGCPPAGWRP